MHYFDFLRSFQLPRLRKDSALRMLRNYGVVNEETLIQSIEKLYSSKNEALKFWTRKREDYWCLRSRLESLPQSLSYESMIPFGEVAFFPGKITRTNEVLVLLGQDIFVERSTFQAIQIIDGRLKPERNNDLTTSDASDIEENISQLKKVMDDCQHQISLWNLSKSSASADANNLIEIKEEFNTESEQTWKERHRERVCEEKKRVAGNGRPPKVTQEEFASLMKRLEELEHEEVQGSSANADTSKAKKVCWGSLEEESKKNENLESLQPAPETVPPPILKNRFEKSPIDTVALSASTDLFVNKVVESGSRSAFTGEILEREVSTDPVKETKLQQRPLSKFKKHKK